MSEVIKIQGLKKSFDDFDVLKGVDFTLNEGENVVVLGRSGTGKSVMIKCIVGLITPDAGSIELLGENVSTLDEKSLQALQRQTGFLFQGAALYDSMSVRENLAFPLRVEKLHKDEVNSRIEEVLESVGLSEAIDKMPAELSGGMRKRIGLARTLITRPKIILYDEPTTGLDAITSKEISALILEMQKKYQTSSIIITHDMPCARMTANRIVVLKEGEFIAEGSYEELEASDDERVRAFFE